MMVRPLTLPRQEDQDVALLQLAHDLDRHLVALGAADDGGEAGHAAVDQLDAPGAQLDVVDRPVQVAVAAVAGSQPLRRQSGLVKLPPAMWKPGCARAPRR